MSESDWVQYFRANAAEPCLPWDDGYQLSGAERAVVIESIQQFQLGENAEGRRLLQRAEKADPEFVQALRLFIREEQRHSDLLGRFLVKQGARCLHRHWVHAAFRRVRGFAGLELRMRVLATAEVLAIPYYTALRDATWIAVAAFHLWPHSIGRSAAPAFSSVHVRAFEFAAFGPGARSGAGRASMVPHDDDAGCLDGTPARVSRRRIFVRAALEAEPY